MKQRMFLLLQYLLVVVAILGSLFIIHKNALKGRTILLPGKDIEAIVIDSKDQVWVATTWDGVVMYEGMKSTSFDSIGDSTWITTIGVDENDQVWVIAGAGVLAAYSPATIYKFNGSDWVATGQTTGRPDKNDLPCCLPNDEAIVSSQIFDEYSAFLEIANQISNFDRPRFLKDKQGKMWAGTDSGLVHFSSDFKIPPPPLKALHVFLSSGGYWILGVIITIVFYETSGKWAKSKQLKSFFLSNGRAMLGSTGYFVLGFAGWFIVSLFSNLFILSLFDNPYKAEIEVITSMTVFQLFGYGLTYLAVRKNKRLIGIGIIIASALYLVGFILRSGCAPAGLPFPISIISFC